MLHGVRKRLLPAAARGVYAKAKVDFEEKNYAAAVDGFTELLAIVSDPDAADARPSLSDLKQLGEGFLKLATAEAAAATKAASPPAAATTTPASPREPAIYSADDLEVTPPVEIQRAMPAWTPSLPTHARLEFRGTLEVVVDEKGSVTSAAIRKPTTPGYDAVLLEAEDLALSAGDAKRRTGAVPHVHRRPAQTRQSGLTLTDRTSRRATSTCLSGRARRGAAA